MVLRILFSEFSDLLHFFTCASAIHNLEALVWELMF